MYECDLNLRIAAGESIALISESASKYDEHYQSESHGLLTQLATDSSKSRSRKDRKEQKTRFRDVLSCVQDRQPPHVRVKLGKQELTLDGWYSILQYQWFCNQLGSGMDIHLATNDKLRDVFHLVDPRTLLDWEAPYRTGKFARL